MELYVGVIGIIGVVFVVIFGGRGLIDLVRGYTERRRARVGLADDSGEPSTASLAVEAHEAAGPTAAVPMVEPDPVYRRTFVGRDAELKQLHDSFDEALVSHGSLAMVVGEPGIGKTSLCEQLAGYVAEKGGKTLVGHCYEEGSLSLPYLAFVEAVRSHVLVIEPDDLKSQLAQGADELARIVPEIRGRMQIEPSPLGDPEEDRYRLLQAASDFLRNAAAAQPLLVVLEDLHDADRGTLDMLAHLARNLTGAKLMVIGTYRDVDVDRSHPLSSALAELHRVTSFERIALRGLTQDEVHRMLQAIAGHEVPWRWAEVVHQQTEGNPLFVQEVMRYLVEEGLLERQEGELRRVGDQPLAAKIPEGLRDVIGKRMTRLSEACNQVLSVASVIGREFHLETLRAVSGLEEEPLTNALEEATKAAVLQEVVQPGVVRYRFTHAFFRQTLYEELIAPRRLRLHQDVARSLEAQHAGRLEEHAAELAEHFSQSTDGSDLAKAVTYGEMAASRAMDVFAYSEATRLLDQALQVQAVLDPGDKAKRCDLLIALGHALLPTAELHRITESVAPEALGLAQALGDGARASAIGRMALETARAESGTAELTAEYVRWVEVADQYAVPGSIDRVTADTHLGMVKYMTGNRQGALPLGRRALELARDIGDAHTLFYAAGRAMLYSEAPQDSAERFRLAEEFASAPDEGVGLGALTQVLQNVIWAFVTNGERARAEENWRRVTELGERTRHSGPLLVSLEQESIFATIDGRLVEALDAGERLVSTAEEMGVPRRGRQRVVRLIMKALLYLGRLEEAMGFIDQLLEQPSQRLERQLNSIEADRSLFLAHLGRKEEAREVLRRFLDEQDLRSAENESPGALVSIALETAVLIEDRQAAEALADRLARSGVSAISCGGAGRLDCPGRHVGEAAALLGRPDEARTRYDWTLKACAKIRFRPEVALTRLGLAELLLDHYPGERTEAQEHLDFAISEFGVMKMQTSLEKAEALRLAQTN